MKNRISLIIAFTILVWSVTYLPYENANGSVVSDVAPLLQGNVHQKNQILFQDDYSSDAGWTQIGTTVTVNSPSFPGVVYFNNAQGGVSSIEERGNFAGDNQLAAWVGPARTATPGIPISANTQYYV